MAANVLPYDKANVFPYDKVNVFPYDKANVFPYDKVNVLPYDNSIVSYVRMNTSIEKMREDHRYFSKMVIADSISWKKVTISNQGMEIRSANPFYKTRAHPLLQRALRNRMQGTTLGMQPHRNKVQKSCQYLQEWHKKIGSVGKRPPSADRNLSALRAV